MRLIDADALVEKLKKLYAVAFAEGDSAYHSAYRGLAIIVDDAPTVGEWIPVSERLPSQTGEYLVTVYFEGCIWTDKFEYTPTLDGGWRDNETNPQVIDWNDSVIAWMPLPEPYKGDTGETR